MKNTLEANNSRITVSEEQISKVEDRVVEITATEQHKEKRKKRNENCPREIWYNIKYTNICIIGVPEGEEKEKGPEKIFEDIIGENLPNLRKKALTQVQEMQRNL